MGKQACLPYTRETYQPKSMSFLKILPIAVVAALGSIAEPVSAQSMHSGHPYMEHNNTGSLGTPPGKFHFLTDDERAALGLYERGLEKLNKQDYQGAIADFTQVLKLTPKHDMAYYNRGNALRQLGKYQAAIDDYSKALETNPKFTYLRHNRGNLREALGDITGAIDDYTQAINSYPEEGIGYSNRGFALYKLGDIQAALTDLNESIRINPGYAGAYINRGKIYAGLGKKQDAIADYQQAKSLYLNQGKKDEYLKAVLALSTL